MQNIRHNFNFRLFIVIAATVVVSWLFFSKLWLLFIPVAVVWISLVYYLLRWDKSYVKKVAMMLDAIDNNDFSYRINTRGRTSNDKLVSESLNRITQLILEAKKEAVQKEKYYELIMNSVNTGIVVLDDQGVIYQTNNEAMRLLGLNVFTHVNQLARLDEQLKNSISRIQPGEKQQFSFQNERGSVHLSVRVSEMTLQQKHVRILAINDINSELDEKEIDSWMRLTRVLTHEIMNSVTPITSLSDTLLSMKDETSEPVRNGLRVISKTGKSLITFVESYRKFTHIPTPEPTLFYVKDFAERMIQLARHHTHYPNIRFSIHIEPHDLIVYADENLISQVVLNLLKNAMQAIGHKNTNGEIEIRACCNREEAVLIEVINNGPAIPADEAEHIFVPFFTTKSGGSGIGLSISRQIMRLSGGSLTLKSSVSGGKTVFLLLFP